VNRPSTGRCVHRGSGNQCRLAHALLVRWLCSVGDPEDKCKRKGKIVMDRFFFSKEHRDTQRRQLFRRFSPPSSGLHGQQGEHDGEADVRSGAATGRRGGGATGAAEVRRSGCTQPRGGAQNAAEEEGAGRRHRRMVVFREQRQAEGGAGAATVEGAPIRRRSEGWRIPGRRWRVSLVRRGKSQELPFAGDAGITTTGEATGARFLGAFITSECGRRGGRSGSMTTSANPDLLGGPAKRKPPSGRSIRYFIARGGGAKKTISSGGDSS